MGPAPGAKYCKQSDCTQPVLWTVGAPDADPSKDSKLHRLQQKVDSNGGRVVDSKQVWCTVCEQTVPLHQECSMQRWDSHILKATHKGALAMAAALTPVYGSHIWIVRRKHTWRRLTQDRLSRRPKKAKDDGLQDRLARRLEQQEAEKRGLFLFEN